MSGVLAGLYAITDDNLLAGRLLPAVAQALAGGCRVVQYRSKQMDAVRCHAEASGLLSLCRAAGAVLLINDDIALAQAIGAHGVHLGQTDASLAEARSALGPEAVIGITCHDSLALACAAQTGGASYVAFGRFFPSGTKRAAPPAGLSVLGRAKAALQIPVVAIGGITLDNAAGVITAGADMVAVVGDLFSAADIAARAGAYGALFSGYRHDPL